MYMEMYWLLATFICAGHVTADISSLNPSSGTCVCLTTSHVNAHVSPGIDTAVHSSLMKNDCYKFHGGILTKGDYRWYQLQNVNGENLWVAGNFLNTATASHCASGAASSSGTSCHDSNAKNLACEILELHNAGRIHLWDRHPSGQHDNAYAYNNIRDTCHGIAASRSSYSCSICLSGAPGGHVCLSRALLQYIYNLGSKGYIHVNEIAGACHHCGSKHYDGTAVDLDIGSRKTEFMNTCRAEGGFALDEINHIHCNF